MIRIKAAGGSRGQGHSAAAEAPLLCAGLIGFRAWRMGCAGRTVKAPGLYGFGAAAHLLAQLALWRGQQVYAFVRPGDDAAAALARELGLRRHRQPFRAAPQCLL